MGVGRDPKRSRGRHNRSSRPLIKPLVLSDPFAIVLSDLEKSLCTVKHGKRLVNLDFCI
jgi:hypothetical protein